MTIQIDKFEPIKNVVFVSDMESGNKLTRGGILLLDDNNKNEGIRERWARVYAVGPEVTDLKKGDWVLLQHGRWTPGIKFEEADGTELKLWRIDYPDAVITIADDIPEGGRPDDVAMAISHARPF